MEKNYLSQVFINHFGVTKLHKSNGTDDGATTYSFYRNSYNGIMSPEYAYLETQ
jgi:hypothetical protein